MKTLADTLMNVNEEAACPRTAVLRPWVAASPEALGGDARRALQGALRSGARGDREPDRRRPERRALHMPPDGAARAVAADRVSSLARAQGGGPHRGLAQDPDDDLLPARARRNGAAGLRDRRRAIAG